MGITRDGIQIGRKTVSSKLFLVGIFKFALVFSPPELSPIKVTVSSRDHMNKHHSTDFFFVGTCSANTSMQYLALNSRMKRGSLNNSLSKARKIQRYSITDQSSLATPRSLQHLINALLLHASVAVGIPEGSKYSCSPRATATSLASFGWMY